MLRAKGWTGERVCLAGDSAGGNLCVTVSMKVVAHGVRLPDGIMSAYPATMLSACVSPSRLLSVMDPLLPLSVLSRCLSAYAGMEPQEEQQVEKVSTLGTVRRDTALLFRDLKQGASNWIHSLLDPSKSSADVVRNSVSDGTLAAPRFDHQVPGSASEFSERSESLKSHTCEGLVTCTSGTSSISSHKSPADKNSAIPALNHNPVCDDTAFGSKVDDASRHFSKDPDPSQFSSISSMAVPPLNGNTDSVIPWEFPEDFEPLRSEQLAEMKVDASPIYRNPYMSPLLAPNDMLRGLPPIHIVACALDPMLDDSVMFAKRLQNIDQPVTLCVVDDLPHGFLSLSQLSKETREASNVCMERIRDVFTMKDPSPKMHKHRKLERTDCRSSGLYSMSLKSLSKEN